MIDRLRIGYRRYRVELVPCGELEDRGRLGECSYRDCTIRVSDGQLPADQVETVVHEALHTLFHDVGMTMSSDEEETIVSHLTPRLTAFLADNPDAVRTMLDILAQEEP